MLTSISFNSFRIFNIFHFYLFSNQYLENDQLDFEEMKVANVCQFTLHATTSCFMIHKFVHNLLVNCQYLQVSQSAGPALRDIANSDAKLRRSSIERKQVCAYFTSRHIICYFRSDK